MDQPTPIVTTISPEWNAADRPGQRDALMAWLFGPVTATDSAGVAE